MEPVAITLSQEQHELQALARKFAEQEIKPIAAERDRIADPGQTFPWDVWRKGAKLGFRTLAMPREYGGRQIDILTHCVVLEELSVADASLGGTFHQNWKLQQLLLRTDAVRQRYLAEYLADDDYLLCVAATEPDAGTDYTLPYDGVDGGVRTTAVRQANGDWLINGKKHFIFQGGIAKGAFLLCRTDTTKGMMQGATVFFIDLKETPGFRYGHIHDKMGWRSVPNGELIFEDVRLPDDTRVSEVNQAMAFLRSFGKPHAPTTAVFPIATGRAACELTIDWCRNQKRGGKTLLEQQTTMMRLAEMWADVEVARAITWKTAWSGEHNPDHDTKLGPISQLFSAEMAVRVCRKALQIWGGRGFRRDHPIEKLMRDSYGYYHTDGLNDINLIRIGQALAGRAGGSFIG